MMCCCITPCVLLYHTIPLFECSLMEQKVDQLTEMTAELNRKLLKLLEEGRVACTLGGDKADTHGMDDADK